jgi:hypothetical protein
MAGTAFRVHYTYPKEEIPLEITKKQKKPGYE